MEELSFQEVEEILESIISNKRLLEVKTKDGTEFIVFSYPTTDYIVRSRYIRNKALLEAEKEGLPSIEDIDRMLEEKGIINDEDDASIKELEEKIQGQKKLLELTKIPARKIPIREAISNYEKQLEDIRAKGENYYYLTGEKKADEEAVWFLAWASSFDVEGLPYWSTFQDFEDETDLVMRHSVLINYMNFNRGYETEIIRFIARHSLWRIRYVAALKTGGNLFSRDLNDLTTDQLGLLYWSNYYQSIYEMMPDDQPDEETIKDDSALDKYMENYFKRKEADRNEGRVKRNSGAGRKEKLSAWNRSDELLITPAHPQYMDLQYTEERLKAGENTSDIEAVAPGSRRARNRAAARRGRR